MQQIEAMSFLLNGGGVDDCAKFVGVDRRSLNAWTRLPLWAKEYQERVRKRLDGICAKLDRELERRVASSEVLEGMSHKDFLELYKGIRRIAAPARESLSPIMPHMPIVLLNATGQAVPRPPADHVKIVAEPAPDEAAQPCSLPRPDNTAE